jgi:hypothetical protein
MTTMNRRTFAIGIGALMAGACREHTPQPVLSQSGRRSMREALTFLTRDGCVNTPDMLTNLDAALKALGLALDYQVVNIGTLAKTDSRTGYPTPTVLYRGRDLFGMPQPTPPFPEPA